MNQRMRILKLLQEGKISLEQAEHLLEMMDQKSSAADRGGSFDRWNLRELRQLGTQITSAVSQSLSDVRKTIEQQVEQWTGPWTQHTLSVSTVVSVPEGVRDLSLETVNGGIHVSVADQSAGHIEVRGQVKADQWSVAAKVLEDAVKTHHSGERLDLAVIHGKVGGDSPGAVVSAQLHVVLPASMGVLALRSHNGSLNLDSVRAEELRLDTVNGSVTVHDSTFARLFVTTDNGRVEVYDSITTRCQSVYASAKSGTLRIHGKHPDVRMEGTARTAFGRIDIPVSRFEVVADEDARPTFVRFAEKNAGDGVHRMRVQLETRSGNIRISPAAADSPL